MLILIDGAGWHREGGNLSGPDNITLIRFPAYCPELNAQENVWEYLRPNFLASKVFDTYDDIVNGCCTGWNELIATTGKIKSIASRSWLTSQVLTWGRWYYADSLFKLIKQNLRIKAFFGTNEIAVKT